MPRSIPLIRPLVAAALVLALAAPAAFAVPVDVRSPGHPSQHTHSTGAQVHNPVYWSYDYEAADPDDAAALAQERAYSSFVKAKPVPAAATHDDDTPWAVIGLSISAALLAVLAGAGVVVKTRVRRAHRVAA
jgi:rhodanese-related sulfurtransferase